MGAVAASAGRAAGRSAYGGQSAGALPRVSIGLPVYNAERYLAECLDALLAQDHTDFELIISDNASTDQTWAICQRYAAADPRIRLYRSPVNRGGHANFARVVELARGELFKWVAYDDVCLPSYVGSCVAALDTAGPDTILAYPRTILIDEAGGTIGPYPDRMDLRGPRPWRRVAGVARHVSLCHAHFGVFRLVALRRTGLIRPYVSSDYTLLAEVARLGRIHEVDRPLFLRRLHGASTLQAKGATAATAAAWFGPPTGTQHPGSPSDTGQPHRPAGTTQTGRASRAPRACAPGSAAAHWRMVRETVAMLAGGDLPVATRLSCAAAFPIVWYARRVRVLLGRWRRQLFRRPRFARTRSNA